MKTVHVKRTLKVLTMLLLLTDGATLAEAARKPVSVQLRCEYLNNPLGIEAMRPRLSWIITSDQRGQKQTAYQVLVASSESLLKQNKGDLWDSGKVQSDHSVLVAYNGKPLASGAQCFWKVRAWGIDQKSSPWSESALWTMGLLKPEDWQAKWICWQGSDTNISPWLRTAFDLPEAPTRA
ncbi:MAG: alpha-galactosidase, partial [Verrucomicrobia bacterium]|nr:alpha-galactosidase [Verrucomicrobiota bacterium]